MVEEAPEVLRAEAARLRDSARSAALMASSRELAAVRADALADALERVERRRGRLLAAEAELLASTAVLGAGSGRADREAVGAAVQRARRAARKLARAQARLTAVAGGAGTAVPEPGPVGPAIGAVTPPDAI